MVPWRVVLFFVSSRRRHTRLQGDWSSDVCSSDLGTPNTPPVAMAAGSPLSGIVPLTVNFSSAGSYDPDGSVAGYSWNFGDGSPSSTAAAPSHVYSNAGNFTAVLTVTDNRGATSTAQVAVTASPDPNFINAPSNLTGSAGKSSAKLTWNDRSEERRVGKECRSRWSP